MSSLLTCQRQPARISLYRSIGVLEQSRPEERTSHYSNLQYIDWVSLIIIRKFLFCRIVTQTQKVDIYGYLDLLQLECASSKCSNGYLFPLSRKPYDQLWDFRVPVSKETNLCTAISYGSYGSYGTFVRFPGWPSECSIA